MARSEPMEDDAEAGPVPSPVVRLPDPDERRTLDGLGRQDPSVLGELYAEHGEALLRLVLGPRVPDADQARDLLHETFLTAFEKGPGFRWRGIGLFHWLRGIALNKLRAASRAVFRERARSVPLEAALPWLAADGGPAEKLEASARLERLKASVARVFEALAERDRAVIRLRLVEHRSREDAAAALAVTVPHLDVLLYRAVRRFRSLFGPRGGDCDGT